MELNPPRRVVTGLDAEGRSLEDIAKTLASIVALLKGKKAGLRSEQIRAALKLDKREMPRVLKMGLAKKAIRSKGQKRSTTYFAA